MVIPESVPFDCVGDVGTSHLWLHFSPLHHLGPSLDRPLETPLVPALGTAIAEVVAAHRAPAADPLRLQRLYHAASALLHATLARLPVRLHHDYPERLQEVIGLIESAPGADLGNPELARRCGMAPDTFIRWFKQHTGSTPAAFVARSRVRQAAQRLVLSERSVDEIAADAGFADRFHFTRVFRKHMGCGPAQFRKRHVGV
jgi:AraC-like DNA-binding protein